VRAVRVKPSLAVKREHGGNGPLEPLVVARERLKQAREVVHPAASVPAAGAASAGLWPGQ